VAAEAAVPGAGHHLAELVAADPDQGPGVAVQPEGIREQRKRFVFCSVDTDVFDSKAPQATRERIWRPSGRVDPPPVRTDEGNSTGVRSRFRPVRRYA
jgi:hypothetical protein